MHTGQQIRDYVLGQKIGEGGMGEVWSATHQVLHRQVAIKSMANRLAADPQSEQRFVGEARAQANLQHPRIVGVTDFFRENGVDYLVMPLVNGRSLHDRLAEAGGPLPTGEAMTIASDILDALDYAHQRGIIHRDVKPSNILLDREGNACLTDFGIALLVGQDRRTRTGTSLGTPHYMSPEQIRAPRTIDHRADVYSASCVIYEMLAGRPPFLADDMEGNADYALLEAHLHREPQPVRRWNPSVPLAVDLVILRGLAKDPNQRYSGCGELRRALNAAAAGLTPPPLPAAIRQAPPPVPPPLPPPIHQPPPIPLPAPAPRPSRGGFFLGIGLGIALAFAALVALGFMMSQQEEPEVEESTTTPMEEPPGLVTDSMPALFEPPPPPAPSAPAAKIVNVTVDHEAQQEGRTGMLIHIHFTISNARNDECQLNAYFYSSSGEPLKDFDQDYHSVSGQASVGEAFTPPFDETEYKDFVLFMPHDELHMAEGKFDLKFDVQVHHMPTGKMLAESPWVEFTYTKQ